MYLFIYIIYIYISGWWFQICFIFTPKIGEDYPVDEHIFQMGGKKPPTRFVCLDFFLRQIIYIYIIIIFIYKKIVLLQRSHS